MTEESTKKEDQGTEKSKEESKPEAPEEAPKTEHTTPATEHHHIPPAPKESLFNFGKMDKTKILTILVSATLVLTLINSLGIFFTDGSEGGSVTGNVVKDTGVKVQPAPTAPPTTARSVIEIGDAPIKGDNDAPVTIIEFSDYECPFCGRAQPTLKQVEEQYGDKVRIVYMDFPLSFHQNADSAAQAARCVRDQLGVEGYWDMHDELFANQQSLSKALYTKLATELGADADDFNSCLDSNKHASAVQEDFKKGQAAGVRGTPAFFINGNMLSGAQPFPAFQTIIDAELA